MLNRIMLIAILIALPMESNLLGFPPLRMSGGCTPLKVMGGYTQCYSYITRYDSVEVKKWIDETSKYNEKGNVLARTLIHINGDTMTKETFKYDNNDSCIEYIEYYVNEPPSKEKIISKYDESGKKIESIFYEGDEEEDENVTKLIFKYDEKGNLIEQYASSEDSKIIILSYKYYENGEPIAEFILGDDNKPWQIVSKYDDKRNKIEMFQYDWDGAIDYKYTYCYDIEGKVIEETWLNSKGIVNLTNYEYDEFGNIIEELHYMDFNLESKQEYIYSK